MKSIYTSFSILFFYSFNFLSFLQAQSIVTVGLSKYTNQLRTIIEQEGYNIQNLVYKDISTQTLEGKTAITLFNLRQTWDQEQLFTPTQVDAILAFVREGGTLYLTSRKGYQNLLEPLGIEISGVDGNQTGREWPLIKLSINHFVPHPLTQNLNAIQTDVCAYFSTSPEWTVLGYASHKTPLLAIRKWGLGKVILGSGERTFRDPSPTSNRYETDISIESNFQYHVNLFNYLPNDFTVSNLSLSSTIETDNIDVFPNPTSGLVYLQGKNIEKVEIIAVNGQLLKTITNLKNLVSIDLSSFPKGFYQLNITTEQGSATKEIIVK